MKRIVESFKILLIAIAVGGVDPAQSEKHERFHLVDYKKKGFGFELDRGIEEKILSECEEGSIIVDVSHAIFGYSFKKDYLYIELAIHHPGHWDPKSYSYLIAQKEKYADWGTCRILIPSLEARAQFFTRDIGTKSIDDSVTESESGVWENMKR